MAVDKGWYDPKICVPSCDGCCNSYICIVETKDGKRFEAEFFSMNETWEAASSVFDVSFCIVQNEEIKQWIPAHLYNKIYKSGEVNA